MDNDGFKEYRERTDKRIDKVEKEIHGNGNEGMKSQMILNTKFRIKWEKISTGITMWLIIQTLLLIATMAVMLST